MSSAAPPADPGAHMRARERLQVVIPVFDDWEAVRLLLQALRGACKDTDCELDILLVDDGSEVRAPNDLVQHPEPAIVRVRILSLRRNVGHQRAICIALAYLAVNESPASVLMMDGDGEDDPRDVPRLLAEFRRYNGSRLVFARRGRRSEGLVFSVFYRLYRVLHRLLTGLPVEVGNFSIIPASAVETLSVSAESWNHYAAAVVAARLPRQLVDTTRAPRLQGTSRMNWSALVLHGLSAISVFADRVGIRMLVVTSVTALVLLGALLAVFWIRFFTPLAIPGWATSASGLIAILLTQTVVMAGGFTFLLLSLRSGTGFLPRRDYEHFVSGVDEVFRSDV